MRKNNKGLVSKRFGMSVTTSIGHYWQTPETNKYPHSGLIICRETGMVSPYIHEAYSDPKIRSIICVDKDRFEFKNPKDILALDQLIYSSSVEAPFFLVPKIICLLLFISCSMATVYSTPLLILLLPVYLLYSLFAYRQWKKYFYTKKIMIQFLNAIDSDFSAIENKYNNAGVAIPKQLKSLRYSKYLMHTLAIELLRSEDVEERKDVIFSPPPETRSLRARKKTCALNLIFYAYVCKVDADFFKDKKSKSFIKKLFGDVFD